MRNNWRDCQEWIKSGMPLSTTSDVACKLYDASVSQLSSFYNDSSVGGFQKSVQDMLEADPTFVMGNVFANTLLVNSSTKTIRRDEDLKQKIEELKEMAKKQTDLTEREKLHVKALVLLAEGEKCKATQVWREILLDNPTDVHALNDCIMTYVFIGDAEGIRDCAGSVLPYYSPSTPGHGVALSYYAFGLEETNYFSEAEKEAYRCLELDRHNGWATHTLAHAYLHQGKREKGVKLMYETESDWSTCDLLSCHNYWHTALFEIEKGNHEEALGIYDKQIGPMANAAKASFPYTDASSLLCRLELEGIDVNRRWQNIMEICKTFQGTHSTMFVDAHNIFTCYKSGNKEIGEEWMESMKEYASTCRGDNARICREVGIPLCEGIALYENGEFEKAAEVLSPLQYKIKDIGGSNAQRDVFIQFLIHSNLRSPNKTHQKIGRSLITARKNLKIDDPQADRWSQMLDAHVE